MTNNLINSKSKTLPYYVAKYNGRVVAVKREPSYQATIKLLQKSISQLRGAEPQDILISTSLEDYGDTLVEISEEIWSDVVGDVKLVEISLDEAQNSENWPLGSDDTISVTHELENTDVKIPRTATAIAGHARSRSPSATLGSIQTLNDPEESSADRISITIRTPSQTLVPFNDLRTTPTIQDVKRLIESEYVIPIALQQLQFSGARLDDETALGQSGVVKGTVLDLILNTRKSIIYLLPAYESQFDGIENRYSLRISYDITVEFVVNRRWELGAFRPYANNSTSDYIQRKSWTVDSLSEDKIYDCRSRSRVPWTYWDGSPVTQSPSENEATVPNEFAKLSRIAETPQSRLNLSHNNSVLVRFDNVEVYLSAVLTSLLASRPSLLRPFLIHLNSKPCSHIAIRFLPQDELKGAAMLSVSGHPNARIIHIAMLYKRLDDSTSESWDESPPFTDDWQSIIDPESILQVPHRSEIIAIDFSFLEIS